MKLGNNRTYLMVIEANLWNPSAVSLALVQDFYYANGVQVTGIQLIPPQLSLPQRAWLPL